MPRIRTIKPEFWSHPKMRRLSESAQLMALALLNYADDHGYFLADPALIRSFARPFDEDSRITTASVRELCCMTPEPFIRVFLHPEHGPIGVVCKFKENQVVNKARESRLQGYFLFASSESSLNPTVKIPDYYREEGRGKEQGKERNGREEGKPPNNTSPSQYSQADFDQRDIRKFGDACQKYDRMVASRVGTKQMSQTQAFEWLCAEAGITVKRGLEIEKIQRQWPENAPEWAQESA